MNRGAKIALAFGGAFVAIGAIVLVSQKDAKASTLPDVKPPLPTDGQPPAHPDEGGVVVVPPHGPDEPAAPPVVVPAPEGGFDRTGPFAVPGIQDAAEANRILLRWWSAEGAAFPPSELPPGLPRDFGSFPDDLSSSFGPRAAKIAEAFCQGNCKTATLKALQQSGSLTADLVLALKRWEAANQLPPAEAPIAPSAPAPIVINDPRTNTPIQVETADLPPVLPSPPVAPVPAQPPSPAVAPAAPQPSVPPFVPAMPAPPAPVPVPAVAPAAAPPGPSVSADTALLVKALLADEATPNWKRKSPAVQAWQKSRGLKQDGEFGPKSAITVAQEIGAVPIVRYWPTGAQQTKAVRDYQAALLTLANAAPEPRASQLRIAAQREQGQGFGSKQTALPASQLIHLEVA
jgi:hypothetical protein